MKLDDYLHSTELLDCQGRVSHVLQVRPEGTVTVRRGSLEAIVEPTSRTVSPPGARLGAGEYGHEQIIDLACALVSTIGH